MASNLKHGFCGSQIQFGLVDLYKVAVKMLAKGYVILNAWLGLGHLLP